MRTKKLLIIILVLFLVVSFFMVSILSACRDERRCTRCGYLEEKDAYVVEREYLAFTLIRQR